MKKLTREDLWSLEEYSSRREEFRKQAMQHKRNRRMSLTEHATLHFEDRLSMHYQIQEMLRAERIFESAEIQDELDTYNMLIPDDDNWKATLMFEYEDPAERAVALHRMPGIEHHLFVQVGDGEPIEAIANEDLDRSERNKTAAVHFVRYQFDDSSLERLKSNALVWVGIVHPEMPCRVQLTDSLREELVRDLAS